MTKDRFLCMVPQKTCATKEPVRTLPHTTVSCNFWNQHDKCNHLEHVIKTSETIFEKIIVLSKGPPYGFLLFLEKFHLLGRLLKLCIFSEQRESTHKTKDLCQKYLGVISSSWLGIYKQVDLQILFHKTIEYSNPGVCLCRHVSNRCLL